jgi:hypothetical protein
MGPNGARNRCSRACKEAYTTGLLILWAWVSSDVLKNSIGSREKRKPSSLEEHGVQPQVDAKVCPSFDIIHTKGVPDTTE